MRRHACGPNTMCPVRSRLLMLPRPFDSKVFCASPPPARCFGWTSNRHLYTHTNRHPRHEYEMSAATQSIQARSAQLRWFKCPPNKGSRGQMWFNVWMGWRALGCNNNLPAKHAGDVLRPTTETGGNLRQMGDMPQSNKADARVGAPHRRKASPFSPR